MRRGQDAAAEAGSAVMENIQSMGASAKRMATEGYEQLRDTANQYIEQGKEKACEMSDSMQNRVKEQPMKAILAAAAVGFVVGMLFTRR
jgi:ElaB/YqjD/DUF883 family membrane-anchored ribosome-binding protein